MMLYQDRLYSLINVLALQAVVLALSVAWQATSIDAPHLYITRGDRAWLQGHHHSGGAQGDGVPPGHPPRGSKRSSASAHHARRHRPGRPVNEVMLPVTAKVDPVAREDIALALSVVLLGLLMMVTRRNAVSQVIGFMSLENSINLAATGAQACPWWSKSAWPSPFLIAFIVIGIFLFRIRERFDTVDRARLDQFRGERR